MSQAATIVILLLFGMVIEHFWAPITFVTNLFSSIFG